MSLTQRIPFLRWSFWRVVAGALNIATTGQIGDGREAAAVEYVLTHARAGDIDDVLATIDRFAYDKSLLINVGDEKGALLDAAVRRADPKWRSSWAPMSAMARCASRGPPPPPGRTPSSSPKPTPSTPAKSGRTPASPTGSRAWSASSATVGTRWTS